MRSKIIDVLLKLGVNCKLVGFDNAVSVIEYLILNHNQTHMYSAYNFVAEHSGMSAQSVIRTIKYAFSKINTENIFYKKHFSNIKKESASMLLTISEKIRTGEIK